MDQLDLHRLHFAFTVIVHYLFPQLTMGLSLLLVVLKTMALRGDDRAERSVRFWAKILGVTFVMGVVTGIPMEFQFGTNWSRFSAAAGGVIGHALAMEGVFAFFLESSFLYLVLFAEKRLGPRGHWLATVLLCFGTWLSGYFIVCTNAWMQHPVGYALAADGTVRLVSLGAVLGSPWAIHQYMHTMVGSVITASFVMAAVGAYYLLRDEHAAVARRFTSVAVVAGLVSAVLAAMPTGDVQAKFVYRYQPVTFAAMEGHFHTADGAGLVLVGQPNPDTMHLDNPIVLPKVLSFLTHRRWNARVEGLAEFPPDRWPTNVPMLYYAYHMMAGLGTIFIAIMAVAAWSLLRGRLAERRWLLWILMLALPFPFIANTAGWMTAEVGRQPWIIYDVMRTADGDSTNVSAGNALFTLLGFAGLYVLLGILYFFLTTRIIARGPQAPDQ